MSNRGLFFTLLSDPLYGNWERVGSPDQDPLGYLIRCRHCGTRVTIPSEALVVGRGVDRLFHCRCTERPARMARLKAHRPTRSLRRSLARVAIRRRPCC